MIAIGHDIIEIKRIRRAAELFGDSFFAKVFSEEEIQYCLKKGNPYQSLAARFAAKEAVSKALGCGIGKYLSWKSVSIVNDKFSKPIVILDEKGKEMLKNVGGSEIFISLTHTKEIASAVAIVK